eukprot:1954178-Pyramimonas_sp.AAC.1
MPHGTQGDHYRGPQEPPDRSPEGPEKMCRASAPHWEARSPILWKLNDAGEENVNMQWMPSHKSRA